MKYSFLFLFTIVLSFAIFSCQEVHEKVVDVDLHHDLTKIKKAGRLTVAVDYSSTNYFVYRGQPMGFKYELLKELARDLNVELEIKVNSNLRESFDGLHKDHYDLIAKNLIVTKETMKLADFTFPIMQTRQVLVQRKPNNYREMSAGSLEKYMVRNQLDLAGKTIYVPSGSAYYRRLVNLSDEIGADIDVRTDSIYGVEQLVSMVARGEIDYTVCDENVAEVNQGYYPILDVKTPISFPQNIAWGVRKNSKEWLDYLNKWLETFRNSPKYAMLYKRYFENSRSIKAVYKEYHSQKGAISEYDDMIKEESVAVGVDWRLVAAIIFKESNFDPAAESWAGAYGLMQVMPDTGEHYNIDNIQDPRMNIRAGLRNLKWLDGQFAKTVPDQNERIRFVLAAYNVGLGHVQDAQRLAIKYHKDPAIWTDNVDYYMLNKSASKYYRDRVVKWGYCQGDETYNFVNEVMTTYMHYKNAIPELEEKKVG